MIKSQVRQAIIERPAATAYIKAADGDGFQGALGRGHHAGRGIILNNIRHRSGLLILNQFRGVMGNAEGRVKNISVSQQADTPAAPPCPPS